VGVTGLVTRSTARDPDERGHEGDPDDYDPAWDTEYLDEFEGKDFKGDRR
jgi:hypothetical protein